MNTSQPDSGAAPRAALPMKLSHYAVSRRTFLTGSVLASTASGGLLTGFTTAFATKQPMLPVTPFSRRPEVLQQAVRFSGHQQTVRAVAWPPDGMTLASGDDGGSLFLWTLDGHIRQQIAHPSGVTALAWSPAGTLLASGSRTSVRFFDGQTAVPLVSARIPHTALITCLTWSTSSGHPLLSGSLDTRVIVWDTHSFQPQATFTHHTAAVTSLSCQLDSTAVASVSRGGVVRVWRVDTLAEVNGFYQDARLPLHAVAFAPRGNQLAVASDDGYVRRWNNALVCRQSSFTTQGTQCIDAPMRFRASPAPIRSVSWSPDGRFLAAGGEDGHLAVWISPPESIPALLTKTLLPDPVEAVAWSPVRARIAVASGKTVTIWNLRV